MNKPPKRPDRRHTAEEYRHSPPADRGGMKRDRQDRRAYPDRDRDSLSSIASRERYEASPQKTTPLRTSRRTFSPASKSPSKFAHPLPKKPAPTDLPPEAQSLPQPQKQRLNWLLGWQFWGSLVVLLSGATGFTATALLLKMPAVPNCPEIFLPTASASVRLYCAQVAANKQDAENLLYAIQLVEDLPPDHPLRFEIDRLMESWVSEALRWGEEKYQAGELEEALALAREFSLRFHKTTLVEERIAHWQSTWSKGERIEGEIEDLMERSAWGQAFQAAAKLTQLNNRYWATNRYDQWYERLNLARQESRKLDKAFIQLERGGLDNLLGAIALAEDVPRESSAYVESRSLLSEAADALLDLAFQNLQAGNWQGAMEVANSIPAKFNLNEEIIDINNLADAASTAAYGSIVNLEDAINLAREIAPGRPLYSRTQNLIRRWQTEIEGISNLAQADRLAREGSVSALNAAIEQARLIAANNPRYSQARQKITQWQRRIENIKNRSPLEGGIQFTSAESSSNTNSPLSFNSPPRPLPSETRPTPSTGDLPNTRNSTRNSTRDRALLDRAVALAEQGRYAEAMQLSGRIGADSSSYLEAKNYRDRWQGEARSQVVLTRAYKRAAERTPNGLRTAIETARTIPGNSRVGRQSQQAIAAWSAEILSLARGEASRNLQQAIAIAQQVPPNTPAYVIARSQIEIWQGILATPPVPNLNKPPRDSQ